MQIGPKGAEFVAETLKYNTTISVLDLRGNGLRDEVCICQYNVMLINRNRSTHLIFEFSFLSPTV